MQYYLNLHHVLDTRRLGAKEAGRHGPRVIIVRTLSPQHLSLRSLL